MKTKLKKLWSGLLCIVLLMSLLPSTAFAADNTVTSLSIKVTEYELGKNIADIQITAENPGIEIQSAGVKRIDANGNLSDAIGTFESGVKYGVEIYLTGKSGYDVSGLAETNVTVNGENPDCFDSGSTMRVWYILNELKSSSVKSLSEESSESNVIDYDTNAQDTQAPSQNDESSTEAESDMQLANMPKAGADTYTFDSGVLTILAPAGLIDWKTDTAFGSADITKLVVGSAVSEVPATEFRSCDNIESITFEGDINLTSCTDPENTSKLLLPFENMKSLHNITFKGNANISDAFEKCAELEKVTFENTGRVGGYSLKECPKISSLTFNSAITLTDGALVSDSSNPNNALTELVFPAGSEVENSLFSNYSVLKSVTFEGDVELRQNVFYNCNALETVTFKGESTIGGSAFSNCPNIKALNFEKKVIVTDGALYTTLENRNDALTELVFPEGSRVDNSIFYNYKALKSVTFEGDVELGQSVFCNCNALETVTFKGKSTIGGSAFSNCPSIKTLRFAKKTTLTDGAFYTDSDNLNRSLTELVFPDGSKVVNNLFMNYKALKSVTFEGDADLKQGVFSYCDALETVTFNGESVIGQSAFYDCPSLESVIFKKKTMLSESAFGCTEEKPNSAMTELVLPGDSTIKDGAFRNYSKLNKVTIKKGAKLGTKILPGCSALETFIFEADTPQDFESLTFTNFEPENITIYVPDVEKYKEALEKDTGSDLDKHYNIEFVDRLKKLHIHNLTLVPAKDAACTEEGNKAYYICDGCDKWFEDAEGKSEITDKTSVIIPATGHTLSNVPAKDATCTEEGNKAYYICDRCDKWFEDAQGKSEITDKTSVIIPATGHTLSNVPAKDATCTEEGNKAYYICDGCDKWFEDAEGKSEITDKTSVIISAAGHTLSDWKADDNSHWHECECGYKADVAQHSFKWVVDKEANATQKGAKHEECTVCGYKRASVEIPATGTTIAPTTTPTTTPATTPKKDSTTTSTTTTTSAVKNPKTGDNSNIFLWIVLLLISGGTVSCIIIYDKKRKYNMK